MKNETIVSEQKLYRVLSRKDELYPSFCQVRFRKEWQITSQIRHLQIIEYIWVFESLFNVMGKNYSTLLCTALLLK